MTKRFKSTDTDRDVVIKSALSISDYFAISKTRKFSRKSIKAKAVTINLSLDSLVNILL